MSNLLITIIYGFTIGIILSVDAFMLAIVFGSTFKRKAESLFTSLLVGFFHFFMPVLGYNIARLVFKQINLTSLLEDNIKYIAFSILVLLGLIIIIKKEESVGFNIGSLVNKFLFAFSVSVDSFLTGIAINTIPEIMIYLTSIIFALVSCTLTYIALNIGKSTADKLVNARLDFYAGLLMIVLAFITLFI